jgi:hypothetical protein
VCGTSESREIPSDNKIKEFSKQMNSEGILSPDKKVTYSSLDFLLDKVQKYDKKNTKISKHAFSDSSGNSDVDELFGDKSTSIPNLTVNTSQK